MTTYFFYVPVFFNGITSTSPQQKRLQYFQSDVTFRMSGQFIQGNICLHTDEYAKYSIGQIHINVAKIKL